MYIIKIWAEMPEIQYCSQYNIYFCLKAILDCSRFLRHYYSTILLVFYRRNKPSEGWINIYKNVFPLLTYWHIIAMYVGRMPLVL